MAGTPGEPFHALRAVLQSTPAASPARRKLAGEPASGSSRNAKSSFARCWSETALRPIELRSLPQQAYLMHLMASGTDNLASTIAQTIGNQSIGAVAALRLVCDEVERHLSWGDLDSASLCVSVGLRLYFRAELLERVERGRFRGLVRRTPRRHHDRHSIDAALALALAGHPRLDVIEASKVSLRPRRPTPAVPQE